MKTSNTTKPHHSGYWATFAIFALFLASSGAPTALYPRYAEVWHLSAGALTIAFGVYAIALLVALLLFGDLSDAVGRRPVIGGALVVLGASLVVFVVADGYVWLLVARVLAGLAAGLITASASAAMLDLEPVNRPGTAALANATGAMGGQAAGVLMSALLVQYAPHPMTLVYEILIIAGAVLGAVYLLRAKETVPVRSRYVIRLELGVPRPAMAAFLAALPCLIATWALASLYMSLGPNVVGDLLGNHNVMLAVSAPALLQLSGTVSAIVLRGRLPRTRMLTGSGALALGSALTAVALGLRDVPIFYVSVAVAGLGFGVAFSGALQTLIELSDAGARATLVATVYVIAYLSFSLPAVVAGFVSISVGLLTTTTIFSSVVAGLSLVSFAATHQSTSPQSARVLDPEPEPESELRTALIRDGCAPTLTQTNAVDQSTI
jgi:MFS family permease